MCRNIVAITMSMINYSSWIKLIYHGIFNFIIYLSTFWHLFHLRSLKYPTPVLRSIQVV